MDERAASVPSFLARGAVSESADSDSNALAGEVISLGWSPARSGPCLRAKGILSISIGGFSRVYDFTRERLIGVKTLWANRAS